MCYIYEKKVPTTMYDCCNADWRWWWLRLVVWVVYVHVLLVITGVVILVILKSTCFLFKLSEPIYIYKTIIGSTQFPTGYNYLTLLNTLTSVLNKVHVLRTFIIHIRSFSLLYMVICHIVFRQTCIYTSS